MTFTFHSNYAVNAVHFVGKVLSHKNFAKPSRARAGLSFVTLKYAEPSLNDSTIEDIVENKGSGSVRSQVG